MATKKTRKPPIKEADVTRAVRDVLDRAKVFHWKVWQGPMSYPKGVSDLVGVRTVKVQDLVDMGVDEVGLFWCCEVKRPGEEPTEHQQAFIDEVARHKGVSFWADNVDTVMERLGLFRRVLPLFSRQREEST